MIVEGYIRLRQESGYDVDEDLKEAYKAANYSVLEKIQEK